MCVSVRLDAALPAFGNVCVCMCVCVCMFTCVCVFPHIPADLTSP